MIGYFPEFERTFAAFGELQRHLERAFADVDGRVYARDTDWPRTSVYENEKALVFVAEVPGLGDKEIEVLLNQDVLTLSGERKATAPEGYTVHRQERRPLRFARSFTLPCKVDGEALGAQLKDGVLTVTLPKAAQAQPRQIPVKAA